jgi:hypothetical protein
MAFLPAGVRLILSRHWGYVERKRLPSRGFFEALKKGHPGHPHFARKEGKNVRRFLGSISAPPSLSSASMRATENPAFALFCPITPLSCHSRTWQDVLSQAGGHGSRRSYIPWAASHAHSRMRQTLGWRARCCAAFALTKPRPTFCRSSVSRVKMRTFWFFRSDRLRELLSTSPQLCPGSRIFRSPEAQFAGFGC